MRTKTRLRVSLSWSGWMLLLGGLVLGRGETEVTPEGDRLFTLKVKPILSGKCFACHGGWADEIKGGLDVTSKASFLRGGDGHSDVLVPGASARSVLLKAIRWEDPDLEMPPKANDRLTPEQIEWVRQWVDQGAPWPSEVRQQSIRDAERRQLKTEAGVIVPTSGGLSDDWTYRRYQEGDVWAFRPRLAAVPPAVQTDAGHPIDRFMMARLEAAGLDPAPQAEPAVLIRRASLDLLGLPPSPGEIRTFIDHWMREPSVAWNELIDRLLASPHYGERWGQHWLDVVRYADTGGYSNDYERSNAWRYRDYVIRAFNDDKPYDQFVVEQIAGDELYELQSESEKDPELLVATGFLRMGPWDPAMVKAPEARQIFIDDVVNAVGQTFLSTTMRCLKCHDHKFDPLPTRDYYRFYAAFAGTQMAERRAPFLPRENLNRFSEGRAFVEKLRQFATDKKEALYRKRETAARRWYAENGREYVSHAERKSLPDDEKPPRHVGLDDVDKGRLKVREQDEWIWNRRLERFQPMVQSVYNGRDPKFLNARKLRMPGKRDGAWRPDSHILMGGALGAPGEKVQPGVLSATAVPARFTGKHEADPYVLDGALEGRRLGLARWIARPENPLTARSFVNRVWGYHFGKGLAANPNQFGAKGAKPSHPKLLDWLANDFVAHGWRVKRLHRLIMTSGTYMRSGQHDDRKGLAMKDPSNSLLSWFPTRRLTAEELRDSMLSVTSELNREVGGVPVKPEMNLEVALQPRMIQFSIAPAYQPSRTPAERNRRSIYVYRVRGQADPFMEVFNQPNPNESCEARHESSVSPQAFTLMNSDLMIDRSIAFALRLESEMNQLPNQVRRAFQLALGRDPTESEATRLRNYVREMEGYHRENPPRPIAFPTAITRSLVEEFSGKPFEYEEILPVYQSYQSDPKPGDVSAGTRALADLCLLLLNSNEFAFVY